MSVPSDIFKRWSDFQIFLMWLCHTFDENLFQISRPAIYRPVDPLSLSFIIGGSCQKYHFYRNKTFVATNMCGDKHFCHAKRRVLSQQTRDNWRELP